VQGKRALIHVIEDAEFQAHERGFRWIEMGNAKEARRLSLRTS
jgi:hypothetical protein